MDPSETDAVRAEALFLSPVQPSESAGEPQVRDAVAEVVDRLGDRECAARVAQEYGDHPEIAARRMRWARRTVERVFPEAPDRWTPATLLVVDTATGTLLHPPSELRDRAS